MASPSTFPAFGGRLEAFDDGHCPETYRFDTKIARIVRHDDNDDASSSSNNHVHIYDSVLNPNDARMLYEVTNTTAHPQQKTDDQTTSSSPWGTYVTIKDALEWIEWKKLEGYQCFDESSNFDEEYILTWRKKMIQFHKWQTKHTHLDEKKEVEQCEEEIVDGMDNVRHALAVEAVAKFFLQTIPLQHGVTAQCKSSDEQTTPLFDTETIQKAHGVAVWALSSNVGNSVQYHIDYAELLRYEYNVTVPPLWAGTIQCSKLWNDQSQTISGGEFCVNLRGLDHYSEHGYKGNLSGDPSGGWQRPDCDKRVHINGDNQWVTIPYAFNRGIVHRGDLPHLSAPIEHISRPELSRVIVGFNVFGHDVGERVAKAPEHSKPFRRKVRLYRSTINTCITTTTTTKDAHAANGGKVLESTGMKISQIRKNKGLTKLLVLAKREKIKEELRRNQHQLSCNIWHRLLDAHQSEIFLQVADIVKELGQHNDGIDGAWPKSVDVHVHLNLLLSTNLSAQVSPFHNRFQDSEGIVGVPATWYRIRTVRSVGKSCKGDGLVPLNSQLDIAEYGKG